MSPSPPPQDPLSRPNTHLLPTSKYDTQAITHLHTLSPSLWAPLIASTHPQALPQAQAQAQAQPHPALDNTSGLIDWLADINWPIALPVAQLLLTLANDAQKRELYGDVLVRAVAAVLERVDEWDWVYWTVVHVVGGIEDGAWMRERFAGSLRLLRGRVSGKAEEEWGFREVVGGLIGEGEGVEEGNGEVVR